MSNVALAELKLLPHVVAYEWRKATAFRGALVFQELLRGLGRPIVMSLVYVAMFRGSHAAAFAGYRLRDLFAYLVWSTLLFKVPTDDRSLDLAEQIFEGYITKYLVMPVSVLTLVGGRFVQFTLLQLASGAVLWSAGALLLPELWPRPASAAALLEAGVLMLLGACCYLLLNLILNCLAFWLDVVWSLLNMFRFVSMFASGALVPVALMPAWLHSGLAWLFPYWTVFAPAEILLGRQGTPEFLRGAAVLAASVLALFWLARFTWRRGLLRFGGSGT